jgi:Tfp pilus assembly protein PilF
VVLVALGVTAHRQAGYWENTRTLFTRALTTINNGSFAHMQLGRFYLTEHDPSAARREYELAAKLAPADFTPEYNLGNLSMTNPADAIGHYQRALKLQPHQARVENNLAVAWIRLGRNDLAVAALRSAIADDPGFVDAHLNLAKLLESVGSFDSAAAEYRAVLQIDPANTQAKVGDR